MNARFPLVLATLLAQALAGCAGDADADPAAAGVPRVGDKYVYRSADGTWFLRVEVGPAVKVMDFDGQAFEAVPLTLETTNGRSRTPAETAYVLRGPGTLFAGLMGCTIMDADDVESCIDLRSLIFERTGGPAPLLLGAPRFADLVDRSEWSAAAPGLKGAGSVTYSVTRIDDDPRWGACASLRQANPQAALSQTAYGSVWVLPPAALSVCERAPAPSYVHVMGIGELGLDHVIVGAGPPAFTGTTGAAGPRLVLSRASEAGVLPPEGRRPAGDFPLHEAFEQARSSDLAFARYLREHPDAVLYASTEDGRRTVTLNGGLGQVREFTRTIEVGPPGSTATYVVDVQKTVTNGSVPLYQVLRSLPTTSPTPVPAALPRRMPTLAEGAETADALQVASFLATSVRGWSPGFGSDRHALADRYHYEYFFDGTEAKGAVMLGSVVFDGADGRLLVVRAPAAAMARLAPVAS